MLRWFYCLLLLQVIHQVTRGIAEELEDSDDLPKTSDPTKESNPKKIKDAKKIEKSRGALGQGFEVQKIDLLTKELQASGAKVFENLDYDKCTKTDESGTTSKDDTFYSDTESLYSSVASNSKIDGSLKTPFTLGASVSAATNNIVSGNTDVSGLSLNLKAQSISHALSKECINNSPLSKNLIKDFEDLGKKIDKPWKSQSWRKYKVFLEKYGSHIVKDVVSGSSIYQYVFAKSSEKFTQKDFKVKACVSLAGPTQVGQVGVSACSDVSKEDIESASKKSMVKKLVVRGGTSKTRADLTDELDKDKINKFLQEGETDPSPILYTFYPLWTILKARYIGTDSFAKALNLEQFYKGFLSFECKYMQSANKKVELQKFELSKDSDPEAPTYICNLGPQGCHDNSDCHTKLPAWCVCSGESCIRYKDEELNSGTKKKIAFLETTKEWKGHGCKRRRNLKCECKEENKNWEESWNGDRDDDAALRDVHHRMLKAKRRDPRPTEL